MKKTINFLLIAMTVILGIGCSGGSKVADPMVYSVNGISDVTIKQYQDTTFYFLLNNLYASGPQESATISVGSLPAGITVTPNSVSGTPTFGSQFTFHAVAGTAGSFPVTITATSASSGSKTYTFNIIVTPIDGLQYTLNTLPTITIPQYTYTIAPINVTATYVSGHQEPVMVSLSSPAYVFDSAMNGYPTFSSSTRMRGAVLTTGTYPVTETSTSASSGTQTHSFNVVVTPSSDCAAGNSKYR